MIFEKRLEIILDTLEDLRQVSNKLLIKKLDVSESTLRRDLDYLEKKGDIKRVHGGAVLTSIEPYEKSYDKNVVLNVESKKNIAKKAASYIKDKSHIFLDGGTSTNFLIDYLKDDVTVITNGLMHLEKLKDKNIKTIFLGGEFKQKTNITVGEKTIEELSNFNFDFAFIGANGYKDGEFTTHDPKEARIKAMAIKRANKAIVLLDRSKEGRLYFSKICSIKDVTLIQEDLWFIL